MCEIVIISPDGSSWLMSLSAEQLQCMTVLRFKEELLKMCATRGYTKDDVKLHVDGKPLDDDCAPVTNYGIKASSTVQIVRKVHGGGLNLPVYSKSSTEDLTVRQFKKKPLEGRTFLGHTKDDVKLHFEGKPLDDDSEVLSNRGIKHGSTVQMTENLEGSQVRLQNKAMYEAPDVSPGGQRWLNQPVYFKSSLEDLTVRRFKKEMPKGSPFTGHTKDDVKLHFEGKPLDDDSEALSNRGIKRGSTVQMTKNLEGSQVRLQNKAMCEIVVISPGGQRCLMSLCAEQLQCMTVRRFKEEVLKIFATREKYLGEIRLVVEGKPLDDDSASLSDCKIKPNSVVQMVTKVHAG